MDFESKYNELVKAARAVVEGNPGLCKIDEGLSRLSKLLPEKESEDEKIRKAISAAICGTTATTILEANGTNLSDALSYLEKQKEQKPAEWSEEDERMRTSIIFTLAGFMGNEDKIDWLKSIRPQPHWKPGKEQMEALEDAKMRMSLDGYGLCPLLQTLINDLKKLM